MTERDKLEKAIKTAAKSGISIRTILGIIESVYNIQFRHYVWRASK